MSEADKIDVEKEIEAVFERLGRGNVDRDTITLLISKLIQLRHPDRTIEFLSESEIKVTRLDGKSGTMNFHNLWIECEQVPTGRASIVDRSVRAIFPQDNDADEENPLSESLIALVRDFNYLEFVKEEDRELVTSHLVGDLWIVYAVDLPYSTVVLSRKQVDELGLGADAMLALGIENAQRLLGEMHFSPYGECYSLGCANIGYASSALLMPFVWEQAATAVEGDLIIAVPARDTVLFTGLASAKGLQEIREAASHVVTTGHHVMTETLLRRVDGKWILFS